MQSVPANRYKNIHIYKSKDSRYPNDPGKEYYQAYLAPYGMIASIHSFDAIKNGIITMVINSGIAYEFEVRQAFNEYKSNL